MITVLEPVCHGLEHVPVNAALLEVIATAFPDEPLRVLAEATHGDALRSTVGPALAARAGWETVRLPPRRSGFGGRWTGEWRLLGAIARRSTAADLLVCLSAAPSTLLVLKLARATGRLRAPAQAVLHGIVADLTGWRSHNPFRRAVDLRTAVTLPPQQGLRYLVLEDHIVERLATAAPAIARHFAALPHPLLASELHEPAEPASGAPLRIGFLGLASTAKGFPAFVELAQRVGAQRPGGAEFHAIGSLPFDAPVTDFPGLATSPGRDKLPRTEFLARLRQLHYVCLPYAGDHYDLTASGVLQDAITNATPVLALPTPAVRALFAAAAPGVCAPDLAGLEAAILERLDRPDPASYAREVAVMASHRAARLPTALAARYRRQTLADRDPARHDATQA